MDIFAFIFIVIFLAVAGSAWAHLRSNGRSIQEMRSNNQISAGGLEIDAPESLECSGHHGHSHLDVHPHGDSGGHHDGSFDGGDHGWFDGGGGHH
jgi:hypothetical protein